LPFEGSRLGQHEAIVDAAEWAAVQAVFAVNDDERRRATPRRRSPAFLLAGLVVSAAKTAH